MLNSQKERKAVYETASIFTDFGWFFREQPISDFGIDVFVETAKDDRPAGNFIALQIKGGNSNFHRSKKGLTFYFNDVHKEYWLKVRKTFLVLIILQDSKSGEIYWEEICEERILQTPKHWKILVPFENQLNRNSKGKIEELSNTHNLSELYSDEYLYIAKIPDNNKDLAAIEVAFQCKSKTGLECVVKNDRWKETINMNYWPSWSDWDNLKGELKWSHTYYYTLHSIKKFILSNIDDIRSEDDEKRKLNGAIQELRVVISNRGIKGLDEFLFDWNNIKNDVPKYSEFIRAFEFCKNISKDKYTVQALDHLLYFQVQGEEYVIDTYEGKTEELKFFIEHKSLDEIYTETKENIWSEIYLDGGIKKAVFIQAMLGHWEDYWGNLYRVINEKVGSTIHLDSSKENSWRRFQIFSEGYSDEADIIKYASAFDDMILYPLAVVTMMKIFNAEVCYQEYCEFEFESGEWESICTNDEDEETPVFYIKINR